MLHLLMPSTLPQALPFLEPPVNCFMSALALANGIESHTTSKAMDLVICHSPSFHLWWIGGTELIIKQHGCVSSPKQL